MRKFLDTFGLVVSSFAGVLLFAKGNYVLFGAVLACQYISFLSYSTRIRNLPLYPPPPIFLVGSLLALVVYLLSCAIFKSLIM